MIVSLLDQILIRKEAEAKYHEFYEEAQEYDVLFFGKSHVQFAVSPMELWNDYGIRSFCIAEPGSRLSVSYWVLKNALQYCDPQLVVLDVRRLESDDFHTESVHVQFDKMPFGRLKTEAVCDLFETLEDRIDLLVPFTMFHSRWTELTRNDFRTEDYRLNKGGCGYDTNNVTVYTPHAYEIVPESEKLQDYTPSVEYLEKMIRMCQERGIEVLLVNAPYIPKARLPQLRENAAADMAAEYGIHYLNFLHIDGVVDFETDMRDSGHVNFSGMNKVTAYLGEYMRQCYKIPDRRNEPGREAWDQDYEAYLDSVFRKMREVEEAENELVLLSDQGIDSCIYIKAGSALLEDTGYHTLIQNVAASVGTGAKLQQAADQKKDYLLIVDRARGTASEYVGLSGVQQLDVSYGSVAFGTDGAGEPYLRINGSDTDYLAGKQDIRMIAMKAGTGTVENVIGFDVMTKRSK